MDQRFWSHVSAFGALWGCLEITVGAFVHSLRIPFGGVFLASIGVCILIASRHILPSFGSSIAIAVVASLLKSLSPGGVILGPMVGIFMEGLIVELVLLVHPTSWVSAVVAGILVASLAAFQKILVQIILYGAPIIDLYVAMLHKATAWLGMPQEYGWWAIGVLVFLLALIGAAGGLLGTMLGRQVRREMGLSR